MNNSTQDEQQARERERWQSMWLRLREEMHHLVAKDVAQISPYVVLGYMDYILQLERK